MNSKSKKVILSPGCACLSLRPYISRLDKAGQGLFPDIVEFTGLPDKGQDRTTAYSAEDPRLREHAGYGSGNRGVCRIGFL